MCTEYYHFAHAHVWVGLSKVNKQKYYGSGHCKQMLRCGGAETIPCLH